MVQNFVLLWQASGVVKDDFRTYKRQYTSPNEMFEYGHTYSDALLQLCLKFERCKSHKIAHNPTKCDKINDVKLFMTIYRRSHIFYVILSDVTIQKQLQ